MSIITKGYGVQKEAIVTQGYGRLIEQAVVDAIEAVTSRRPRGSSAASRRRKKEREQDEDYTEWTVSAIIIDVNDKDLFVPLKHEINKKIKNLKLDVSVQNISLNKLEDTNETKIEVKIKQVNKKKK